MPLGFERINARRRQPNERIVFIKPLNGPDKNIAQDFLERIAAIVNPIMKDSHLSVMSLEEFPPNTEFWGRNFNAGEVIQLVLKHPRTGMWLSFGFVQGVMVEAFATWQIHELAHIKQMNHSGAFWAVRNKFARELELLHRKGYTGEGFWSTGRSLASGQPFMHNRPLAQDELPSQLCGGTYRSRRRHLTGGEGSTMKRKITYAERQEKKREKKFIKPHGNGITLGGNETERIEIESQIGTKKPVLKAPKIASSKRSRELRAAAALKRLEGQAAENEIEVGKKLSVVESESEYEEGNWSYDEEDEKVAVDVGGGKRLVPVSRMEDNVQIKEEEDKELQELVSCGTAGGWLNGNGSDILGSETKDSSSTLQEVTPIIPARQTAGAKMEPEVIDLSGDSPQKAPVVKPQCHCSSNVPKLSSPTLYTPGSKALAIYPSFRPTACSVTRTFLRCPACSVDNVPGAICCVVCLNVFEPKLHPGSWKCTAGGEYWNSSDAGICGVCGEKKKGN